MSIPNSIGDRFYEHYLKAKSYDTFDLGIRETESGVEILWFRFWNGDFRFHLDQSYFYSFTSGTSDRDGDRLILDGGFNPKTFLVHDMMCKLIKDKEIQNEAPRMRRLSPDACLKIATQRTTISGNFLSGYSGQRIVYSIPWGIPGIDYSALKDPVFEQKKRKASQVFEQKKRKASQVFEDKREQPKRHCKIPHTSDYMRERPKRQRKAPMIFNPSGDDYRLSKTKEDEIIQPAVLDAQITVGKTRIKKYADNLHRTTFDCHIPIKLRLKLQFNK